MNIIYVNINGLRKMRKRTMLEGLMRDLHAGICVVTETLLRGDLGKLKYDYYHVVAD